MNYYIFYNLVLEEQKRLTELNANDTPRDCRALEALSELQDYLTNRIAEENERSRVERPFEFY